MWWRGCPGQECFMRPVLKSFFVLLAIPSFAPLLQAQSQPSIHTIAVSSFALAGHRFDSSAEQLKSFGRSGEVLEEARAQVLAILASDNACSVWFRAAEPKAAEKFGSLRYELDSAGSTEIV